MVIFLHQANYLRYLVAELGGHPPELVCEALPFLAIVCDVLVGLDALLAIKPARKWTGFMFFYYSRDDATNWPA